MKILKTINNTQGGTIYVTACGKTYIINFVFPETVQQAIDRFFSSVKIVSSVKREDQIQTACNTKNEQEKTDNRKTRRRKNDLNGNG